MPHDPFKSEQPVSLQGRLLLASPQLDDGIFNRAVIFLSDHSAEDGAVGIILNHPSKATVGDLVPDPELAALRHLPVFTGGPVATDQLSFSNMSLNAQKGLTFIPRLPPEKALQLAKRKNNLLKATVGYAGWSPGQLENELLQNTWITAKVTPNLFSLPHDLSLWSQLLETISPYHSLIAKAPANLFLN